MGDIVVETDAALAVERGRAAFEQPRVGAVTTRYSIDEEVKDHLYLLDNVWIYTCSEFLGMTTSRFNAGILLTSDREPVRVCTEEGESRFGAFAARPALQTSAGCQPGRFVCLLLSPLHPQFRRFSAIARPGIIALDRQKFVAFDRAIEAAYLGKLTYDQSSSMVSGVVAAAALQLPRAASVDPRIRRVLAFINENPRCTLVELSSAFGMSVCRMSHVFRESVGLPIKTYFRWQRFHNASLLMGRGQTPLTEIAQAAGYADLSHFGREFREVVGVSPSKILRNDRVHVVNWRLSELALPTSARSVQAQGAMAPPQFANSFDAV